jgi:hypothetical protein
MPGAGAPSCFSKPSLDALVVVAVTWWPRATSWGTSRRPMAPVPPATNTRMTMLNHRLEVTGGIEADASAEMLRTFFAGRRGPAVE